MIPIKLIHRGNLGNKMFQYVYCKTLQRLLVESDVYDYLMPEWNLEGRKIGLRGRCLYVNGGHKCNLSWLANKILKENYNGLLFGGYMQRLEYYPDKSFFASHFISQIPVNESCLSDDFITINVRGSEILQGVHRDYNPLPISFLEYVVNRSMLKPVIMGQLGDDQYSVEIRKRFAGCTFLPSISPLHDFEIVRRSTNIIVSVSSFSWLAAWLSTKAKRIHLPISGFLNPIQRPDIDLLPIDDERYRFYDLPAYHWEATDVQYTALLERGIQYKAVQPQRNEVQSSTALRP